jgi:mannitol-1-phosphate/altronate dehydrogenase
MYRASTSNLINSNKDRINLIDAVVDKIVPPQKSTSLDVLVEEYGSIILDEETNIKPLNQSEIVSYKNYENEFYKKLWLLNGLHLKLAYFGLSQNLKFIHEVMQNEEGKIFASESINALAKAYKIYSKTDENLETFSKIILNRFSLPDLQDEVHRVARNPEVKFSINERFEHPLRYLISEDEEIKTFTEVLDIIFNNNFDEVEGFNNFKLTELTNDKKYFYNKFWKIDTNIQKYTKRLGE